MPPLLSVVVVTFNDRPGLQNTLMSLAPLVRSAAGQVEVCVADGGSPYDVMAFVEETLPFSRVRSERDRGIYDGMNKGLAMTTGNHVWFLNGGDTCLVREWRDLKGKLEAHPQELVLHDYKLRLADGVEIVRRSRPVWYLNHALPTSHQAIFYPGDAARRMAYDLSYEVSGDYAFTARMVNSGIRATLGGAVVAAFHPGGTSTVRIRDVSREAFRVQGEILTLPMYRRLISQFLFFLSRARWRLLTRNGDGIGT